MFFRSTVPLRNHTLIKKKLSGKLNDLHCRYTCVLPRKGYSMFEGWSKFEYDISPSGHSFG